MQPASAALFADTIAGPGICSTTTGCTVDEINLAGGLQIGNYLFTEFKPAFTGDVSTGIRNNAGINVRIIPQIVGDDVGFGLSFPLTSVGDQQKNLTLAYLAAGLNGNLLTGIRTALTGAGTKGNGSVSMVETAYDSSGLFQQLARLEVGLPAGPTEDQENFLGGPRQFAYITKDLYSAGNSVFGDFGSEGHFSAVTNFQGTVPVPTPALLPGLIAFGTGVLRKRKQLADKAVLN